MAWRAWAIRLSCAAVALLGAIGASPAHECAQVVEDILDVFAFGEGRLGGAPDWRRVEAAALHDATCVHYASVQTADCAYLDGEGVWTTVFGAEITRKEILDLNAYSGKPIFGISGRPMVSDVLRAVEERGGQGLQWTVKIGDGGIATTGLCLRDGGGQPWELFFRFDDRHQVTSIGARLDWH